MTALPRWALTFFSRRKLRSDLPRHHEPRANGGGGALRGHTGHPWPRRAQRQSCPGPPRSITALQSGYDLSDARIGVETAGVRRPPTLDGRAVPHREMNVRIRRAPRAGRTYI